jgi:hypothetical protein
MRLKRGALLRFALFAATFATTLTIRIWGIDQHTWMLRDQIRDWTIALGSFTDLPLVGPATHVGGYTVGPAFYWILWSIRVLVGPWFDNLPHAGGIGQAMLQSGADVLLLGAAWRRTGSLSLAVAATLLVATAAYDLCLSAIVWNPMMGSTLAKAATALVLLDWPKGSLTRLAVTAAIAWCAVHSYTGAIFAAVGVLAALLVDRDDQSAPTAWRRNLCVIVAVVALLQMPLIIHQVFGQSKGSAMGAVTGSLARILTGQAQPAIGQSWAGFAGAFNFIQGAPWEHSWYVFILVACGAVVAIVYRRDLPVLCVILVPQVLALVGYAMYVGDFLDRYYYFSLMPAAVLTIAFAIAKIRPGWLASATAVAVLITALCVVPGRIRYAATMHRMPQYGALVAGSRTLVRLARPVRAIRTEFKLPPSANAEFPYRILGGVIDRSAPQVAVINADGGVFLQEAGTR